MYQVLIIDDEQTIHDAITILGDWNAIGVEQIHHAKNGEEGFRLLEQYHPEIVLVDMKMPKMNGVDYLRKVIEKYPDTQHIVISAYSNFQFARQAIKSHVLDYLLKPITRLDLNRALRKAYDALNHQRKMQKERNVPWDDYRIEKSLLSLLNGSKADDLNDILPGMGHRYVEYCICSLWITNLEQCCFDYFQDDFELMFHTFLSLFSEHSTEEIPCFSFHNPNSPHTISVIIASHQHGMIEKEVQRLAKSWQALFLEQFKLRVYVGISMPFQHGNSFCMSYFSSEAAAESINMIDETKTINFQGNDFFCASAMVLRESLAEALPPDRHFSVRVQNISVNYLSVLRRSEIFTIRQAFQDLQESYQFFYHICRQLQVPEKSIPHLYYERGIFKNGIRLSFTGFQDYLQLVSNIFKNWIQLLQPYLPTEKSYNIQHVKCYLDKHYCEQINIGTLAEQMYLSKGHLMKIFKENYHCGIYEYIQEKRMERAKELLLDPKQKIKSISQLLGYTNNNYFSKAFHNYYGLSPSEFREQHKA